MDASLGDYQKRYLIKGLRQHFAPPSNLIKMAPIVMMENAP
jgi:hypothetical protein